MAPAAASLTLADALFTAGLVDQLRLRIVPVLIGDGRSLTPANLGERRLRLDHTEAKPTGHVTLAHDVR
jgi:riboflavin biosynthesis pyrimidine reductase